jgi:hypothetical protein
MAVANRLFAQSAERGALPMVDAATADAVDGGEFVGPGGLFRARGPPETQVPSDRARDEDIAARLWEISEAETGVTVEVPTAARTDQ